MVRVTLDLNPTPLPLGYRSTTTQRVKYIPKHGTIMHKCGRHVLVGRHGRPISAHGRPIGNTLDKNGSINLNLESR